MLQVIHRVYECIIHWWIWVQFYTRSSLQMISFGTLARGLAPVLFLTNLVILYIVLNWGMLYLRNAFIISTRVQMGEIVCFELFGSDFVLLLFFFLFSNPFSSNLFTAESYPVASSPLSHNIYHPGYASSGKLLHLLNSMYITLLGHAQKHC